MRLATCVRHHSAQWSLASCHSGLLYVCTHEKGCKLCSSDSGVYKDALATGVVAVKRAVMERYHVYGGRKMKLSRS